MEAMDRARLGYVRGDEEALGARAARCAAGSTEAAREKAGHELASRCEPPTWDELERKGVWRQPYSGETIAFEAFRADPKAHPLPTPSGKIEIYSERLAELAETLEYDSDQVVHPLPIYAPGSEGYESALRERFPFQVIGYHCRQRVHSSFGSVQALNDVVPQVAQVNVLDAERLGVQSGDMLLVENDRGALVIPARVTPRIMPGVVAIPQGAWHEADMQGNRIDFGGCINTLTSARPTPLARGNAQHSILATMRKVSRKEVAELRGSFKLLAVERLVREHAADEVEAAAAAERQQVGKRVGAGKKRASGAKSAGTGGAGFSADGQRKKLPQYGFRFNQSRCNGCKTCEIACKDYHGLENDLALRTVYEFAGGTWKQDASGAWEQDVFAYHLSTSCNHCSNPVCMRFCPVDAIKKTEGGFVVIDHANCGGCQSCMIACPYHAPRFDEVRGVPVKCDGCRDRVLAGGKPICVEACPQRALEFEPYANLSRADGLVATMEPLPSPELTQPNFAIMPSEVAKKAQGCGGQVINIREA